jgi:hypothetical protein
VLLLLVVRVARADQPERDLSHDHERLHPHPGIPARQLGLKWVNFRTYYENKFDLRNEHLSIGFLTFIYHY